MILEVIQAQYFATNCWLFATGKNSECFIVDPGMAVPDLVGQISDVLDRHNLKPIATIATHGHIDHTFSINPLDDKYGLATYIHPKDREFFAQSSRVVDSWRTSSFHSSRDGVTSFREPSDLRELIDETIIDIAGFRLKALHAPGHTPGSTVFVVNDEYLISGDVLFQNSIGNTSLLGGSPEAMKKTLRKVILPMSDDLIVLPGHGAETTIGDERKNNEYLQEKFLRSED
ncbi:MAG: MBL fold metallo-hydrolase [Actinomycetota bacterium]